MSPSARGNAVEQGVHIVMHAIPHQQRLALRRGGPNGHQVVRRLLHVGHVGPRVGQIDSLPEGVNTLLGGLDALREDHYTPREERSCEVHLVPREELVSTVPIPLVLLGVCRYRLDMTCGVVVAPRKE